MASHYFCRFMQSSQTGMKQLFFLSLSTYSLYLCFLTVSVCIILFLPIIFSFLFFSSKLCPVFLFLPHHCFLISSSLPHCCSSPPSPPLFFFSCVFLVIHHSFFVYLSLFHVSLLPDAPPVSSFTSPRFFQLPLFLCLSLSLFLSHPPSIVLK